MDELRQSMEVTVRLGDVMVVDNILLSVIILNQEGEVLVRIYSVHGLVRM